MKKMLLMALLVMFSSTLVGCGTLKGVGEDLKTIGGWFVRGSERVQEGN